MKLSHYKKKVLNTAGYSVMFTKRSYLFLNAKGGSVYVNHRASCGTVEISVAITTKKMCSYTHVQKKICVCLETYFLFY